MIVLRRMTILVTACGIALGCGAQPAPSPGAAPPTTAQSKDEACGAKIDAASSAIRAVIAENQSCENDGDCILVSQGGCVDQCSGMMSAKGKAAYDQASADIGAKYCAPMRADACPMPRSPPCAPPRPPKCTAGRCAG